MHGEFHNGEEVMRDKHGNLTCFVYEGGRKVRKITGKEGDDHETIEEL